ncbi:hypothetical protein FACS189481_4930 [Clostridia bacterium]|nr:hypothetical protein FACS189481_4930 [Clostridia bacterium]
MSDIWGGLLSVVGVVGLFVFLFFVGKRLQSGSIVGGASSKYMAVVDKVMLGPSSYLAVVKIGSKYYLVGVSSAGVTLHGNIDQSDLVQTQKQTVSFGKFRFRGRMPEDKV